MNIVPKMDDKKEGKSIPHVYRRRVLDSKDIDFVVQYYVQNLNKQHHVYERKKTRKKKIVFFSCIAAVLLIFAAYNASVRLSGYLHEDDVISTVELPAPFETLPVSVPEKPVHANKNKKSVEKHKAAAIKGIVVQAKSLQAQQFVKQKDKPKQLKSKKQQAQAKKPAKITKPKTAQKHILTEIKTKQQDTPAKTPITLKRVTKLKTVRYEAPPQAKIKVKKTDKKAVLKKKKLTRVAQSKKDAALKADKMRYAKQIMASSPGIKLVDMVMCEGVKSLKPVGAADNFSSRRVYCWVRLKSKKVPYKLNFTFYHGGKWIYRYTTTVKRKNAVTWCYKTIWEKGEWRVRLTDENENLVGYKTFMHD